MNFLDFPVKVGQNRAMREVQIWRKLSRGPDHNVYCPSGPGPLCTSSEAISLVNRGWLIETDTGWEITSAGETAANRLASGDLRIFDNEPLD